MTAHTKALLCLCVNPFIAPAFAGGSGGHLLRGGQQQRPPVPKLNQTPSSLKAAAEDFDVWSWIQGEGVFMKILDINKATFDDGVEVLADTNIMNDCRSRSMDSFDDDLGIPSCSAWAYMKQGLVPMVYNYPPSFHGVGIIVAKTDAVTENVKRMHVIDGITIGRYANGVDREDTDTQCGDGTVSYRCAAEDFAPRHCGDGDNTLWAPIGNDGSYWPDQFLFDGDQPAFNREHSNRQQCEFGNTDWDTFWNALQSFYAKVGYLSEEGMLPSFDIDVDNGLFLENEVNMEIGAEDLKSLLTSEDTPLAVFVQTNPCSDQMPPSHRDSCPDWTHGDEDTNLLDAKRTACLLQDQINTNYGKWVKVLDANGVLTNSAPDVDRWSYYQHDSNDPRDWLSDTEINCQDYLP